MTSGLPTPPPDAPRGRGRVRPDAHAAASAGGDEARLQQMARSTRERSSGTRRTVTLPGASVVAAGRGAGRAVRHGVVATDDRVRRTWFGGRLDWITPLGWSLVGLGLLLWLLGALLGWVELTTMAATILALVLLCVLVSLGRHRADVDLVVEPLRSHIGGLAQGHLVLTNVSRRTMLPSLVRLPVGETEELIPVPLLRKGAQHRISFPIATPRRGVIPVGPPTTVLGDPLGVTRRTTTFGTQQLMHVHPRHIALESGAHGLLRDLEGEVTPELSMADISFHALREYEPGDDRRHVHWRSSAKHDRLLVRQFQETRRSHLGIVVDTDPAMYPHGEGGVETAIAVAASLMVQSIKDEQEASVVCNDALASRTTVPLVLDTLTTATIGRVDLVRSARAVVQRAPDSSVAVLCTGPGRAFLEIQQCLGEFETEVHKVAVVVDPGAQTSLRRVRGLSVVTITELSDLGRVVGGLVPA
ncbi:DUF58 domain-containing protein [Janibacter limosus]|uniref:DUF58 domain-containing protein n=1 Tax=Janibacter limosus TaxID=53458 RepID=A0A4P6MWX3_9MICO|nr:DUF58 domain-containing protein [Janibacter limosus]QBF47549.1 DUF58 domain-containing protein [Janibacter limosus]